MSVPSGPGKLREEKENTITKVKEEVVDLFDLLYLDSNRG